MDPAPESDDGPSTFVIDGQRISNAEHWEETFTLLADIPPGAHLDLISGAVLDDDGNIAWQQVPIVRFIRAVIAQDDEPRWDVLIRDKDRPLETEQLGALMFWITGEKAGRPTGRRPSSSDGSPTANNGSEAAPSPQDATPTGSTPPA